MNPIAIPGTSIKNRQILKAVFLLFLLPIHCYATKQSDAGTDLLNYADALKTIYRTNNTQNFSKNKQSLDLIGNSNESCNRLKQGKISAAQSYVVSKLPPNPTTVIQESTCFLNVMDIAIPTSGNMFLDSVVNIVSPYLKPHGCKATDDWWNQSVARMKNGTLSSLNSEFSVATQSVNMPQSSLNQVQSYSSLSNGTSTRPTDMSTVIVNKVGTPYTPAGNYTASLSSSTSVKTITVVDGQQSFANYISELLKSLWTGPTSNVESDNVSAQTGG